MNKQRESVYTLRREILEGKVHLDEDEVVDTRGYVLALAEDVLDDQRRPRSPARSIDAEEWDIPALQREAVARVRRRAARRSRRSSSTSRAPTRSATRIWALVDRRATRRRRQLRRRPSSCAASSATSCCRSSTRSGRTTSTRLDHLKEGIGLRGYGQRDPLVEYKKESFALFQDMKARIDEEIVRYLCRLRPVSSEERRRRPVRAAAAPRAAPLIAATTRSATRCRRSAAARRRRRPGAGPAVRAAAGAHRRRRRVVKTVRRDEPKVGRNDPCPCGSGKKYKKCHGARVTVAGERHVFDVRTSLEDAAGHRYGPDAAPIAVDLRHGAHLRRRPAGAAALARSLPSPGGRHRRGSRATSG